MSSLPDTRARAEIKAAIRFYLVFLRAVVARQDNVKGVRLGSEIQQVLETVRISLPESERGLLPEAAGWQHAKRFLGSIEDRPASSGFPASSIDRVRDIYLQVLHILLTRLVAQLDDSVVRLLFRLAARDAMLVDGGTAFDHALLKGVPEAYFRQTGVPMDLHPMPIVAQIGGREGERDGRAIPVPFLPFRHFPVHPSPHPSPFYPKKWS
jgi:hypothetical protein